MIALLLLKKRFPMKMNAVRYYKVLNVMPMNGKTLQVKS